MIWFVIAALCAYFVKGLCGFANTLVFTTILGFTMENRNISPMEVILGYPTNVILAWKERRNMDWKIWFPVSVLMILCSVPGIVLLKNADAGMIKAFFGIAIIGVGIESLLRERWQTQQREQKRGSKAVLILIGILSGLLCGLYGIGALLAAYISRVTESSSAFKANFCMVFVLENTSRILLYLWAGLITEGTVKQAVILMPFMLAGLFAGIKSGEVLNEKTVKKLIIFMLILSGAALFLINV